ncbi:uncharacterized protein E0L32_005990 [Thyridium curvatum]|uniref:Uncharacterized protein n=1 Tax=Thyridium curvatum TaxID=1093900 RepID=A0A507B7Y8_9PEZI|nr:uncharacterized protein E0L32_005990 [Thyridium curvatum]TPX13519.1 hypothetical protein E0L32_005990 [Thyridium curvatum]
MNPYFFLGDEERQECIDTIVGMLPVNLEVLVLTLTIHGTWMGFADMGNILPSAEPDDWDDEALDDETLDRRDRDDIPIRERSVFVASVCLVHLIKRRPELKTIFIDQSLA